jgi:hypothetical protein
VRRLMTFVHAFLRRDVTPERVKSDVTARLSRQEAILRRLGSGPVRDGYRLAGDRFIERRKVPR